MSTTFPGAVYAGRLIDGRFTLLRPLGGTGSSSVFLTEFDDKPKRNAAIKLISADAADAEACIARWERAKTLSHPHLVAVLHHGRCELDGKDLLYVVSEYADEVLSEILPERALAPEETREMLGPVLDALVFLHGQNLVHGHLKPSNILVVDDRLKLSADGIVATGETATRVPSPYDAPEIGTGMISSATDIWSLGIVLIQALTQQPPAWNQDSGREPEVPASTPEPFFSMARECLRIDPTRRLTVSGVKRLLNSADTAPADTAAAPAEIAPAQAAEPAEKQNVVQPALPDIEKVSAEPAGAVAPAAESTTKPSLKSNVQAVIGTLIVIGVALFVMRAGSHHKTPAPSQRSFSSAPAVTRPAAPPSAPPAPIVKGEVASRAMPDIPAKVASTIRGHIKVAIRVQVDAQGNVTQASVDSAGPSRYFADRALDAAQKWKFTPAWIGGTTVPSVWLLHFQFGAAGNEANAHEETP
ncbi:MAG: TonB family protein [Terracidiphilus sp.]